MSEGTIEQVLLGEATWNVTQGDCLKIMPRIPRVDHVITDPPYEEEAHTLQRRVRRGPGNRNAKVEPLNFAPIDADVRQGVCFEWRRLAARWVMAFCQAEAVGEWREVMENAGLAWRRSMVWVKPDGMPQLTGDRPGMGYESIAVAHAPCRSRWNGGGRVGVFVANKNAPIVPGKQEHPTQKPPELMQELIQLFTDPGDVVLDPFAGSGTTGVVATRNGRRTILIERDPAYASLCRERMLAEQQGSTVPAQRAGQMPMFGGDR